MPGGTSRFVVLWRAFLTQFFSSDAVTSDIQQRERLIWVLAFLLPPGLFLVIELFPAYELIARHFPERLDDLLARLAFLLVTYSMVGVGMLAVFVWDALVFERRDAMVLGPLPLSNTVVLAAKLAALGTLLSGGALAVNAITAVPFALVTANRMSLGVLLTHLAAHLIATLSAAAFVFGGLVCARAMLAIVAGPRLATVLGSALQFAFVCGLLCFLILIPAALSPERPPFLEPAAAAWAPTTWFLGAFEYLRGAPNPAFGPLAARAFTATAIVVCGGVLLSLAAFRFQVRSAVTPAASAGALGRARVARVIAHGLSGRNGAARGLAAFLLLTLARSRAQQTPVAISAAIGIALAVAGLSRAEDLESLMRPRTAVLWIPLLLTYWTAMGVRASFFVPSELAAAWAVRLNAPRCARARWIAVRSALAGFLIPPCIALSLALTPLVGWEYAFWHTLLAGAVTAVLIEGITLTVAHVPFTQPFPPGHLRLRTRWPLYLAGMYVCAYWPVRLGLHWPGSPSAIAPLIGVLLTTAYVIDVAGPRFRRAQAEPDGEDEAGDPDRAIVLALG